MKTPNVVRLPQVPRTENAELGTYLRQLQAALEVAFRLIFMDFRYGKSQFEIRSTAPTASTMEEGEIVLFDDEASTRRIYTKMNGAVRYIGLT